MALGTEPVIDPEVWLQGSQDEDRRRLLGVLLAKVELEITAAMRLGHDQDETEVLLGWTGQVGPDSDLSANVLVNRLQRTGVQLMGLDEEETPPGRAASSMAVVVAADTIGAHLHFQAGDVEGVRRALGRAEEKISAGLTFLALVGAVVAQYPGLWKDMFGNGVFLMWPSSLSLARS